MQNMTQNVDKTHSILMSVKNSKFIGLKAGYQASCLINFKGFFLEKPYEFYFQNIKIRYYEILTY